MKTQPLGASDLQISRLAYGCMRLAGTWDRTRVDDNAIRGGIAMVEAAFEAGYTLFDHADVYGDSGCETIFGRALALHPGWREQVVIATKCGIRWRGEPDESAPFRYDLSAAHIVRSVERSLRRLGVETIDLLQLHRPDYLTDPAEIAAAFTELRSAGKVREFGVSNFRASLAAALQAALPFPLQANQLEIHLDRLDCFTDGTLDQCLERTMTPLAWSPLGGGRLIDDGASADARLRGLREALAREAAAQGVDRGAMALGWLMRHPSRIVPIVGSSDPGRIRAAARADEIELDRETWYRLLEAALGERLP